MGSQNQCEYITDGQITLALSWQHFGCHGSLLYWVYTWHLLIPMSSKLGVSWANLWLDDYQIQHWFVFLSTCCCGAWWLHFCERSAFICTKHYITYFGEINFISRVEFVSRVKNCFAWYIWDSMLCDISKRWKYLSSQDTCLRQVGCWIHKNITSFSSLFAKWTSFSLQQSFSCWGSYPQFQQKSSFSYLFLVLPLAIKSAILQKLTNELLYVCVHVQS